MFFRRVKTPGIAHNAYVLGDGGIGIVVDPRRDIGEYLELARQNDLSIRYVLETHRQEDFILGSAAIRDATGAKIVTGDHEIFAHSDLKLADGGELQAGKLKIRALSTPGHTPESVSYAVFLEEAPTMAWGVFTGDALFIGETGRTDLPDPDRTGENAGLLYDAIHQKLSPLGDQCLLLPAHGAGSVCGGNIANRDESTLGIEKASNPVFKVSRDEFILRKQHERIPRPPYFKLMEKVNLMGGRALDGQIRSIRTLQPADFEVACRNGIVIDVRLPEAFAGGHLPGSYSIWMKGLPVFGGWVAGEDTAVYLLLDHTDQVDTAALHLLRIGVERIEATLAGGFEAWRDAGLPVEKSGTITPRELEASLQGRIVLDVREVTEFEDEGHIQGARHIWVGDLEKRIPELEKELGGKPLVVTCGVGHRASLAISILKRHGLADVSNLLGGMTAWKKLSLPTVTTSSSQ